MMKFYSILNQLTIGDMVIVPKSAFNLVQHHAIYLGYYDGHYWFIENKEGLGVRKVTEEAFFKNVVKITRIERFQPRLNYNREDLVRHALSKIGTKYHLIRYNCEHFANEVQHGLVKSSQVNVALGIGTLAGFILLAGVINNGGSSKA